MDLESLLLGIAGGPDEQFEPPRMDPDAQRMELQDRFARYHQAEDFDQGQRVYEKRGLTTLKPGKEPVLMFWRYLHLCPKEPNIRSVNDEHLMAEAHQRFYGSGFDCLIAFLPPSGETLILKATDSRILTSLPPGQQPGARESDPAP